MAKPKISGDLVTESKTVVTATLPSDDQHRMLPEIAGETVVKDEGTKLGLCTDQNSEYEYFDNWGPELKLTLASEPKYYEDNIYDYCYVNDFTNDIF